MSKRNLGIDLLRIVSMFMIIMMHLLGHGGLLSGVNMFTFNYNCIWLLQILCLCSVNCFAIISGYVGITSKHRISNIIKLWLRVVFYAFLIQMGYMLFTNSFSIRTMVNSLLPVTREYYWYFTSYFCLFFFMPIYDEIIHKFDYKIMMRGLTVGFIMFIMVPTLLRRDIFNVNYGTSFLWLSYLYFIGAFIKKYAIFKKTKPNVWLLVFLGSTIGTWLFKIGIEFVTYQIFNQAKLGGMLIQYNSPTILLAAISLFMFFSKLNVNKAEMMIQMFTPLVFGVYLIHDHFAVRNLLVGKLAFLNQFNGLLSILILIAIAFMIYMVCILIDMVRNTLFKVIKVDEHVEVISSKIKFM